MYEKHGHAGVKHSKEYRAYYAMLRRCYEKNNKNYHLYGGRGIRVCEAWRDSFKTFLQDVCLAPTPDHTLDRLDSDGDYEPGNIRWATRKEQSRNRRTTRRIDGVPLGALAEQHGLKYHTIRDRAEAGTDLTRPAIFCPERQITFRGETLNLTEWAQRLGITPTTLRYRIKQWPLEKALTRAKGRWLSWTRSVVER